MTPCSLAESYRSFGGTAVSPFDNPKVKATASSETTGTFCQATPLDLKISPCYLLGGTYKSYKNLSQDFNLSKPRSELGTSQEYTNLHTAKLRKSTRKPEVPSNGNSETIIGPQGYRLNP